MGLHHDKELVTHPDLLTWPSQVTRRRPKPKRGQASLYAALVLGHLVRLDVLPYFVLVLYYHFGLPITGYHLMFIYLYGTLLFCALPKSTLTYCLLNYCLLSLNNSVLNSVTIITKFCT